MLCLLITEFIYHFGNYCELDVFGIIGIENDGSWFLLTEVHAILRESLEFAQALTPESKNLSMLTMFLRNPHSALDF